MQEVQAAINNLNSALRQSQHALTLPLIEINLDNLMRLREMYPNTQSITLQRLSDREVLTEQHLYLLASVFPSLTGLILRDTGLSLNTLGFLTQAASWSGNWPRFLNLRYLDVSEDPITSKGFLLLTQAYFTHQLHTLIAQNAGITTITPEALASLRNLTELDLRGNTLTADSLKALEKSSSISQKTKVIL